jgi:hypothetical protein
MATTLDAPVGKNVGTIPRPNNIKNFARDQKKVIDLLMTITVTQGGKKGEWLAPPLAGADGNCPAFLSDAILAFQKFWKAKGVFHNIDGVVDPDAHTLGKMNELTGGDSQSERDKVADKAFDASRLSLGVALGHLQTLRADINAVPPSSDPASLSATAALLNKHKRNIAVLSWKLLVPADPFNAAFQDALTKVTDLVIRNKNQPKTILAAGTTGMCDPAESWNGGDPLRNHALTLASRPDPKCHLCERFFVLDATDLQRDVVTHEYFHLFGLKDISVNTTAEALNNANTVAQVVAFLTDRARQRNSDGAEPAVPPLPSP